MYCINNEYILFTSEGRIFQVDINSIDIQEIDYGIKERYDIDIWGLVPSISGNILIGGNDYDYSIFVNRNLFMKHVYHVYEENGFLIVTYNGQLSKVRVEVLFDCFDENKYSSIVFNCESNRQNRIVSGSGVSVQLNENANEVIDYSFLLEECDIYAETTIDDLFGTSKQDSSDESERMASYQYKQNIKNAVVDNTSDTNIPDYDPNLHDEIWTPTRVSSLKSYLEFLTKIQSFDSTETDKKARINILMNARTLMEFPWTMKVGKMLPTWRGGDTAFYSGQTYYGAPYHQTGAYVGFESTVKDFIAASKENPQFYAPHYHNGKQCPYYGVDCSSFVSYALNISRLLTGDLEDSQNKILMLSDKQNNGSEILEKMEPGYFLVRGGSHCKLIAAVYRVNNKVKAVATLESQSWTTSSKCNINLYGNYNDILDYIQKAGYNKNDIDKWLADVINTKSGSPASLDDLITVIQKDKGEGYNLCGPKKWEKIEHHHDCGVTISYDGIHSDDLCCEGTGSEKTCYEKNHGITFHKAHHWDGGNPERTTCVFCGKQINHTYTSWLPSNGSHDHERYCVICQEYEYRDHDYGYKNINEKTHTWYCTLAGCDFEVVQAHSGNKECICGLKLCDHSSTAKIYDSETHEIRCTRCDEVISRGKHTYKPCQYGPDPIIYNGIIDVAETEDIGDTEITCDHECLTDTGSLVRIDSLIAADGLDFTESVNSVSGHYLVGTECGYMPNNTVPHSYTSFRQINGNSSSHYKVCECGATVLASHTIKIEDAVKQGCRRYCSDCGYEEYLDHDYTAYTTTKTATCTTPGEKQRTCKVCGHVRVKEIPATGHDYSKTERKEAQCKENGYERVVCSHCGDIQSETVIPYPGHDYGSPTVLSKATCTEAGHRKKTCKVCGYTKYYDYPQATGHSYETITVPATCETDGYTRVKCKTCGDIQSETILTHPGHSYGAYVVTKEATCTAKGTKTKTCSRCGQTSTKKIPATGHSYGAFSVTTPASCTSTGTKSRTCSKCGHVDTEAIPMTAHKYNKKGKCKVCGAQK